MYKTKIKKDEHTYETVTVAKWILDQGQQNLFSGSGMKIPWRVLSLALLQGVQTKGQALPTPSQNDTKNAKFNVKGDTKSTLRNDGGREENAMIKIGNNNKHGTRSCGQRISNSTLTCRVELLFFLPHLQPPSSSSQPPSSSSQPPSSSSSTSIIIPQASLG